MVSVSSLFKLYGQPQTFVFHHCRHLILIYFLLFTCMLSSCQLC